MASLKDVANHAKVSMTTVSRVYNNKGGYSTKTKNRVLKAMKDLGFQPNETARLLQGKNSKMIGLIVPFINHPIFSIVADSIARICDKSDYRLLLAISQADEEKEKELFSALKRNNVAGIILSTCLVDPSFYQNSDLPIISIERELSGVSSIVCDNFDAGEKTAQLFLSSNCKNVLLYGRKVSSWGPTKNIYTAFLEKCKALNIKCTELYYEQKEENDFIKFDNCLNLLRKDREIDGVFTTEDIFAAMLDKEKSLGTINENIKLVSAYNTRLSENFNVSSIHHPFKEEGEIAFSMLLSSIEKKSLPTKNLLPVSIIER